MFAALFSLDGRRKRLLGKTGAGPLRDYLATPFVPRHTPCSAVGYVALDLETTGLDPQHDEILSVGLVCLDGLRIDLATACHWYVLPTRAIPEQSAVIHRITDDRAAQGEPISAVMARLLPLLAGRVLIAHHARIEQGFLAHGCRRLYGGEFIIPTVDTQLVEKRWLEQRMRPYSANDLRLAQLRNRYNLPRYRAHNALSDALACAELFIAQVAGRDSARAPPLKGFLVKP